MLVKILKTFFSERVIDRKWRKCEEREKGREGGRTH
jgi:hypothetical protein